jgi:hypothetical protein
MIRGDPGGRKKRTKENSGRVVQGEQVMFMYRVPLNHSMDADEPE